MATTDDDDDDLVKRLRAEVRAEMFAARLAALDRRAGELNPRLKRALLAAQLDEPGSALLVWNARREAEELLDDFDRLQEEQEESYEVT